MKGDSRSQADIIPVKTIKEVKRSKQHATRINTIHMGDIIYAHSHSLEPTLRFARLLPLLVYTTLFSTVTYGQ